MYSITALNRLQHMADLKQRQLDDHYAKRRAGLSKYQNGCSGLEMDLAALNEGIRALKKECGECTL